MLSQSQIDQFDRDGFLNGGRMMEDEQLAELSRELDRIIDKGPDGFAPDERRPVLFRDLTTARPDNPYGQAASTTPVWQIVNIWQASDAFQRLLYHPPIVKAISQLTRMNELMVWHDQIQYKPAMAGGSTRWHQDSPLWPTILPLTPVSAWIPFDDAEVDNGCMWMVPGSYRWGDHMQYLRTQEHLKTLEEIANVGSDFTPPEDAPIRVIKAVPRPVKRGEVSFHHSLTWHGSPTNTSPRPRRAIAIHYMTGEAIFQGKRGHPMEQFISLEPGAPMSQAGKHFPTVCREGEPVSADADG